MNVFSQLRSCDECGELCLHKERNQSFRDGRVRACPICFSFCVERGPTYQGLCLDCDRGDVLRRMWVEYDSSAVAVVHEHLTMVNT